MKDTCENNIKKTVQILKQLDEKSLLLIDSGVKLLAARQEMERTEKESAQKMEKQAV